MSPEERQVLVELFQRTNAAASQPRDRDAEAFIAEAVRLQPYAPYLLAQAVLLQEQAMKQASERLQQLEAENRDLQERIAQGVAQAGQQAPQGGFLGGLGSLFGGQQRAPEPPPRPGGPWGQAPQATPPQQPGWGAPPPPPQGGQGGPWGGAPQQQAGGGSSFLKGALGAAAGVAGGALLVNSLSGMFGGHGHGAGLGGGLGGGLGQQAGGGTVINNYYGDEGDSQGSGDADYDNASDDSDYDDDSSDDTYDA